MRAQTARAGPNVRVRGEGLAAGDPGGALVTERGQRFPCAAAALVGNTLWLAGPSAQRFVEEDAGVFTRTHACVLPQSFRDMAATPEGLWVLRADATRGVGISHLVPLGDGGLDEDWLPTDEFEAARRNFAPMGLAAGNGRVYLTGLEAWSRSKGRAGNSCRCQTACATCWRRMSRWSGPPMERTSRC